MQVPVTYNYDAFGQLTQQTDAKSNTYNMVYDGFGRITSRAGSEGATAYEYYVSGTCSNNNPTKIMGFNGVIKEYTYDVYKRPATEKITIDGIPYITSFTYDQYNAVTKTVYPSGVEENKTYDANGGLLTVTGGNTGAPVTLFTATAVNGFGQYTGFTLGNGKTSQNTYNYGIPARYYTAGVQDLNMTFDYTKGNLLTRRDAIKNITVNFAFDNLNRLTTATVNTVQQFAISYDGTTTSSMGNITSKTDAGNYVYKTDKIHAVAYITNPAGAQTPPANISTIEQQITYTPFLKTATVSEAPYSLDFTYGPDYERVKTLLKNNGNLQETRLYLGGYEKQIIAGGVTREIHYIAGGNGLCAILVKEAGITTPYYIYTDHLGSLATVTNTAGTIIAEQNFDAWGRKRNPANWQYAGVPVAPGWLYRGFTGHEHLPQFTIINMNGRMYDPIQGRMLSPDNYVSTPFGTQGYNRYSYANNNPLIYTDPDGNNPLIIVAALVGGFLKGMQYDMAGKGSFLDGFWRGAVVSGAGSGLALIGTGGSFLANVAFGVGQGVVVNGLSNILDGNYFFNGALNAGIIGGAFAAVSSGIEAQVNWEGRYKYGTNDGVFKGLLNDAQDKSSLFDINKLKAKELARFWEKRYGGPNIVFSITGDGDGSAWARPDGKIDIPYSYMTHGASFLKASIVHETAHYYNLYQWVDGKFTSAINKSSIVNTDIINGHGTGGYYDAIRYGGRYHIGISGLIDAGEFTKFRNIAWKNFSFWKYWHQIPSRFFSNPFTH